MKMTREEQIALHAGILWKYKENIDQYRVQRQNLHKMTKLHDSILTFWMDRPDSPIPGWGIVLYIGSPNVVNQCPGIVWMVE